MAMKPMMGGKKDMLSAMQARLAGGKKPPKGNAKKSYAAKK